MRKFLSVFLVLMLLLTMAIIPVFADDHISTEDMEFEELVSAEEYALAPEPLYPFVLVPSKEYMFDDAWGTYEEIEGFSAIATNETIAKNDSKLSIPLYVNKKDGEDVVDVDVAIDNWKTASNLCRQEYLKLNELIKGEDNNG